MKIITPKTKLEKIIASALITIFVLAAARIIKKTSPYIKEKINRKIIYYTVTRLYEKSKQKDFYFLPCPENY